MTVRHALRSALVLACLGLVAAGASAQDWREETVRYETQHPYPNDQAGTAFVVERPGATQMRLWFEKLETERGWDFIELYDRTGARVQRLTGTQASFWSNTVQGDKIEVRVVSDRATNGFGALVTKVAVVAPRVETIEIWFNGDRLDATDVLDLPAHGEPGSHPELEVRGYTARGDRVASFPFDAKIRSPEGEPPIKVESKPENKIKVHPGHHAAEEVPVQIYDATRTELSVKFNVTVRPARPKSGRIELVDRGRVVQPADVVTMSIHGQSGDHLELEVRGYDAEGRLLSDFDFNPGFRTTAAAPPATVEKTSARRLLLHAGPTAAANVPVEIYDTTRPELVAKFNLTVQAAPAPGSRVASIQVLDAGRVVQSTDVIRLQATGRPGDRLELDVQALNRRGEVVGGFDFQPAVRTSAASAPITVEKVGAARIRIVAGAQPAQSVPVEIYDTARPELAAKFNVTVEGGSWWGNRVDRIQLVDAGRVVQSVDVIKFQAGGRLELDVQAVNRRGEIVSGFDFSPALRTSASPAPVAIEKVGATRIRLVAGAQPATSVPVEVYDTARTELVAKFNVTIEAGSGWGSRIDRIQLLDAGRVVQSTDVIRFQANGRLELDVQALNRRGEVVSGFDVSPALRTAASPAPISVEKVGATRIRLVAGWQPATSVPVEVYDTVRTELVVKFNVTVERGGWGGRPDELRLLDAGRVIQSTDVLRLAAGARIELDVQAVNRRGEVVSGFDWTPAIRTSATPAPVSVEKVAATRIRLVAGSQAAVSVPIEVYDPARPDLAAKLNVTIEAAPPTSRIARIRFVLPDGAGGERVAAEGETVTLTIKNGGNDRLPFRVEALDRRGQLIDARTANLGVTKSAGAWYGSLESAAPGDWLFRSGVLPHPGMKVAASDPANPTTTASLTLAVVSRRTPPATPVLTAIAFMVPDGRGGERAAAPGETFLLALQGRGADQLPFRIAPRDQNGQEMAWNAPAMEVSTNLTGWYGSVEDQGGGRYLMRSGILPMEGIRVLARSGGVQSELSVATRRGGAGGGSTPPGETAWAKFGDTWMNPDWASEDNYFDIEFTGRRAVSPVNKVKVVARAAFAIEFIRLQFEDGTFEDILTRRTRLNGGDELVVDVTGELRTRRLTQIRARVRGEDGGTLEAFVLTTR